MRPEKKYRIIVLGAGFSAPAGLPLGNELWAEILDRSEALGGGALMFRDDLEAYIRYRRDCDGVELTYDTVNFEEFLGFLDIEHYLEFRGSDTWSKDGNEAQVIIKTLIGQILAKRLPPKDRIHELYLEFARRLQPDDIILTFNYDVLLERALDAVGKSYRLFLTRYESVSNSLDIADSSRDEIIILKVHGSIDWFDKDHYLKLAEMYREKGYDSLPRHPVFNGKVDLGLTKILDGPRHDNDPLLNMYRVADVEELYKQQIVFRATPWILSPSTNKVIYASALADFWHGFNAAGKLNLGLAIIGYSLPSQDIYAKQAVYSLVRNYQEAYWDKEVFGLTGQKKAPLVLVDKKTEKDELERYKENYRFVDFNRTHLHMSGFDEDAIDRIFS